MNSLDYGSDQTKIDFAQSLGFEAKRVIATGAWTTTGNGIPMMSWSGAELIAYLIGYAQARRRRAA